MSSRHVQGSGGHSRGNVGALVLLPRRISQVLCPPPISDGQISIGIAVIVMICL